MEAKPSPKDQPSSPAPSPSPEDRPSRPPPSKSRVKFTAPSPADRPSSLEDRLAALKRRDTMTNLAFDFGTDRQAVEARIGVSSVTGGGGTGNAQA